MTGERVDLRELKSRISLVDVAAKAGVTLRQKGREHVGCCPFHAEKTPSFSIYEKNNGQKFKCFGCGAEGDVISFVEQFFGYSAGEAIRYLNGDKTLSDKPRPAGMKVESGVRGEDPKAKRNKAIARDIWVAAKPYVQHPMISTYLQARGIDVDLIGGVPACLRLHPQLDHFDPETGVVTTWPAILAPVMNAAGKIQAIHRTYLKQDGTGKAPVAPAKMVLGSMRCGFIPLTPADSHLNIGEGIESVLSVKMMHPHESFWTSIALGNMKNVPIPLHVNSITIWADNDMKDPAPGQKDPRAQIYEAAAAFKAAKRGRRVRIAWPPKGMDFNDCLKGAVDV